MQQRWREPEEIAAGDTLTFNRRLSDYPATDGWSLLYVLRGGAQDIEFTSTADLDTHSITVPAATTAAWLPADYILAGYAVNADQRFQVYEGPLTVAPNLPAAPEQNVKTFAQQMVENLEAVMLGKAGGDLLESRIGETQFRYLSPEQLRVEHGYWVTVRNHELAMIRAASGRPTGRKIRPLFRVQSQQPSVGMFGKGTGYLGW